MPALPAAPLTIRVQVKHTLSSDVDVIGRQYFAYTGTPPTAAQLVTMATTLFTNWGTVFAGYLPTTAAITEVIIEDLNTLSGATGLFAGSTAGTLTGVELPAGAAFLMNYQIARRYRGGKPRNYFPFGSSAEVNDSQTWKSTFVANVVSQFGTWISDVKAAAWAGSTITNQVNVSYYSGFASVQNPVTKRWKNIATPRVAPVIDVITGYTGNPKFASQRRRNLHSV